MGDPLAKIKNIPVFIYDLILSKYFKNIWEITVDKTPDDNIIYIDNNLSQNQTTGHTTLFVVSFTFE